MGQFLDIAETVLRKEGRPMKPRAMVDLAKDEGLFSDKLAGLTPHQTMKAKISVDIRRKGSGSRFVRTAPNTFFLRELLDADTRLYDAARQSPPSAGELVLTFPGKLLDTYGRFQGIDRAWRPFLDHTLRPGVCDFRARLDAEQDEDQKQLLSYVLVTRQDRLLSFRRGTFNRVEDYLRGSLCVGFGGHVSNDDVTLFNSGDIRRIVLDNARRELFEELDLPAADKRRLSSGEGLQILGILNDDSSATGRKHIAVVLKYEVFDSSDWDKPIRGEKSITQLEWLDLQHFDRDMREFEYWSQLCLASFYRHAVETQPSFYIRRRSPFRKEHILCIVGGIGSGKSAATKILTSEYGYCPASAGNGESVRPLR